VIFMSDTTALDMFAKAQDDFGALVAGIGDDEWTQPSACSDWDVRTLVNHLVFEQVWVPPMLEGETIEAVGDRFDGDLLGDDPVGAWRRASDGSRQAFFRDGALEGTINSSMGPSPARQYLGEMTFDLVMHRWDLGQGLGIEQRFSDDELALIEQAQEGMASMADQLVAAGIFAPPADVVDDADRQSALLASFGRKG
jgi:uncharacterized protein (TIGR03086 family)